MYNLLYFEKKKWQPTITNTNNSKVIKLIKTIFIKIFTLNKKLHKYLNMIKDPGVPIFCLCEWLCLFFHVPQVNRVGMIS